MKRVAIGVLAVLLGACGGDSKPKPRTIGEHGHGPVIVPCDDAKPNVTALYEAAAKATDQATHDPTYVDDNVAMVMKDCAANPLRVAACAKVATSVEALEHDCLVPLDEEGTEARTVAK